METPLSLFHSFIYSPLSHMELGGEGATDDRGLKRPADSELPRTSKRVHLDVRSSGVVHVAIRLDFNYSLKYRSGEDLASSCILGVFASIDDANEALIEDQLSVVCQWIEDAMDCQEGEEEDPDDEESLGKYFEITGEEEDRSIIKTKVRDDLKMLLELFNSGDYEPRQYAWSVTPHVVVKGCEKEGGRGDVADVI
jgi:hypothetical protein